MTYEDVDMQDNFCLGNPRPGGSKLVYIDKLSAFVPQHRDFEDDDDLLTICIMRPGKGLLYRIMIKSDGKIGSPVSRMSVKVSKAARSCAN